MRLALAGKCVLDIDWLRETCLNFPHVTEQVQWGNDLVFKVAGKMFAVAPLEPAPVCLSFKCSVESFAELTERPKIIPAPYLARATWVALETRDAISRSELSLLLRAAYDIVFRNLRKRTQLELSGHSPSENKPKRKPAMKKKNAAQ